VLRDCRDIQLSGQQGEDVSLQLRVGLRGQTDDNGSWLLQEHKEKQNKEDKATRQMVVLTRSTPL